jgi:hypothetical protein
MQKILLTLLWLGVFICLADVQVSGDGLSYYAYIRSALIDGDLNFYNEDGNYNLHRQPMTPYYARTSTGYVHTVFSIGPALLWLPFTLLAHGWALLSNLPPDGYVFPYIFAMTFGTFLFSTLGLILTYQTTRVLISRKAAVWASLALWLGSAVTFYTFKDAAYSHAASFFAISLLVYWWQKLRQDLFSLQNALYIGVLVGVASLMRWQNVLFGIIPGIDLCFTLAQRLRCNQTPHQIQNPAKTYAPQHYGQESEPSSLYLPYRMLTTSLMLVVGAAIAFSPQMAAWRVLYDRWLVIPQGSGFLRFTHNHVLKVLFSPYHGWFVYTPLVLLGMVGLVMFLRVKPRIAFVLLVALGLQIYISSTVVDWWAGYSFGMRRLINCTPILAIGLGFLIQRSSQNQKLLRIIQVCIILLVIWNLLLVLEVGKRNWLDPEDRSFRFYLNALKLIPKFLNKPWLLWTPGFSYLPTMIYGILNRDPIILQSLIMLGTIGIVGPWLYGALKHIKIHWIIIAIISIFITVNGFVIASDVRTQSIIAFDIARSPLIPLYTRIRAEDEYKSLLVQGTIDISNEKSVEIVNELPDAKGLEILWSWQGEAKNAMVEVSATGQARRQETTVTLDIESQTHLDPVQVQHWLEPYPTPNYIPFWLFPERFSLRREAVYMVYLQLEPISDVRSVQFRLLGGDGTWRIHGISLVPVREQSFESN